MTDERVFALLAKDVNMLELAGESRFAVDSRMRRMRLL